MVLSIERVSVLFIVCCYLSLLRFAAGEYIVVEYFNNEKCNEDFELYAVAVEAGACIINYDTSSSSKVYCSKSDGLQVYQYSQSMECSGSTSILTVFDGA